MVAECPGLLLQLPEHAFDPETVAVEPYDGQRVQCQAGAYQDALDSVHLDQDKPQFLVQLLSP